MGLDPRRPSVGDLRGVACSLAPRRPTGARVDLWDLRACVRGHATGSGLSGSKDAERLSRRTTAGGKPSGPCEDVVGGATRVRVAPPRSRGQQPRKLKKGV